MKKLLPFFILSILILSACHHEGAELSASPQSPEEAAIQEDALVYCASQGGEIEIHPQDDGSMRKVCFINDGKDGIRCDLFLYYKKECGH